MADAFKCDVCGRLIEGRPTVVACAWAVEPLMEPTFPRRDAADVPIVEICVACSHAAQDALREVAESRRELTQIVSSELVRLAGVG